MDFPPEASDDRGTTGADKRATALPTRSLNLSDRLGGRRALERIGGTVAGALSRGQRDALYELVAAGELTDEQARAAVEAVESEGRARDSARARNVLVEIAGYLGAALMLVGGSVLVSGLHDTLTRPVRVSVMAGQIGRAHV